MTFKLNCRADDLAYVFKVEGQKYEFLLHRFVTVRKLSFHHTNLEPVWSIDDTITMPVCPGCGGTHLVECIPDAWLRPVRDKPGEDETLQWKELPTKITEPA